MPEWTVLVSVNCLVFRIAVSKLTDVSSMAASLSSLDAKDIRPNLEGLEGMFRVAAHVHHKDPSSMKLLHGPLGRNSHGAHKQGSLLFDDDVDELRQVAASIVAIGLASVASDLRDEEVHPERELRIAEETLELLNFAAEHFRSVSDSPNDAKTSSIGHGSSKLSPGELKTKSQFRLGLAQMLNMGDDYVRSFPQARQGDES